MTRASVRMVRVNRYKLSLADVSQPDKPPDQRIAQGVTSVVSDALGVGNQHAAQQR